MEIEDRVIRKPEFIGRKAITPEQAAENRRKGRGPVRPRSEIKGILPMSEVTLWRAIRAGHIPPPITIAGIRGWRLSTINELLAKAAS